MEIRLVERNWWDVFKHYHYLKDTIPNNGYVYVGFINNEPVACVVAHRFPHPINKNIVKIARVVTLPHWQGYSIGMRMTEKIIDLEYSDMDVRMTTTLPIVHNYFWKNPSKWIMRYQGIDKSGTAGPNAKFAGNVREVYMETHRYLNDLGSKDAISRKNIPDELKKNYTKEHLKYRKLHNKFIESETEESWKEYLKRVDNN